MERFIDLFPDQMMDDLGRKSGVICPPIKKLREITITIGDIKDEGPKLELVRNGGHRCLFNK